MRGLRKLFVLMVVVVGTFFGAGGAYATNVSGTISQDTTWTSANSPYIVVGDVTVAQGVTLTVEPGVVVKVQPSRSISVSGILDTIGTSENPIIFTTVYDPAYGGSGLSDYSYRWQCIYVGNTGEFNASNITVKYAGYYASSYTPAIQNNGKLNIEYSVVSDSYGQGIKTNTSQRVIINGNTITNNRYDGIYVYNDTATIGNTTISNNNINNRINIYQDGTGTVDITGNTISAGLYISRYSTAALNIQGNTITNNYIEVDLSGLASSIFSGISNNTFSSGKGIKISGSVTRTNIVLPKLEAVYIGGDISIPSGKQLTVEAGTIIRMTPSASISVSGILNTIGTSENPIIFTTVYDPTYGGSGIIDYGYYWRNITIGSSGEFNASNITVKYAGYYGGPIPAIDNSGKLNIENSTIQQNAGYGINHNSTIQPVIICNYFSRNSYGIYNAKSSTMTIDCSYNYWGSPSGPTISSNPSGTGDKVSAGVTYNPWLESYVWFEPEVVTQMFFGEEGTNFATGNFSRNYTDLSVDSPGFDISISRTYNSKDNRTTSPMGRGWIFNFEGSIKDDTNDANTKIVRLPDGSVQTFTKKSDGTYIANDSRNKLVKQADNTFILSTKDQNSFGFSTNGWLVWMKDKNDNTVTINADSSTGKVNSITDAAGRQYTVSYTNGLITSVTDPIGRTVQYEYENNLLKRVIDPMGNSTSYTYDTASYLTQIKDNESNITEAIQYNHENGESKDRVMQTTDKYGNTFSYDYDTSNRVTTLTDSNQRQTKTWYDNQMYPAKTRDAEGKDTITEYFTTGTINKYGEEKSLTDRNGNKTEYERDSKGNVTKITNPDSSTKEYTYDSSNNLLNEKDETGKYTFCIYDANKKNLIKKAQPLNGTDQYSEGANQELFAITNYAYYTEAERQQLGYNAKGLLKTETDPEGHPTTYAYNANGDAASVTDAENNTTSFGYNQIGWKTSAASPKGYNTQYVYDHNGRIEKTTLDGGETIRVTYDTEGRKTKEVSPNQYDLSLDDIVNHTYTGNHGTRYTYYTNGLVHTITDAEDNTTAYEYDLYGNMTKETKPNGAIHSYEYDVMNRLASKSFKENEAAQAQILEEYEYAILADKKTQKTQKLYLNDTESAITVFKYDYAERMVEQQNPDGTVKTFAYQANGNLTSSTDEGANTTNYKYDGLNRLTEQWTPFESTNGVKYSYTSTAYDKAGRKTASTIGKDKVDLYGIPQSQITKWYEYYGNGLLKSESNNVGSKTEYEYDFDGNISKEAVYTAVYEGVASRNITEFVNNHLGKPVQKKVHIKAGDLAGNEFESQQDTILTVTYTYDANGNLQTETTPDNITATYAYDRMNRKISEIQPVEDENGNTVTAEVYSAYNWDGQVILQIDPNGNNTSYSYDLMGRLKTVTNAENGIAAYYYDRAGRKTAEVLPASYSPSKAIEEMDRTEYAYDLMNRLLTTTNIYQDGEWKAVVSKAYKYDSKGNMTKELDALGYNAGSGESVQEKIASGYGTEYTYNLAGKISTMLDPVSQERGLTFTTKYEYDSASRKIAETNAKGVIKTYCYDDANNLSSLS
ncbi:MAG: DUF6531 domain-containing protein, partial [Deltaproteobacteria bacterium]